MISVTFNTMATGSGAAVGGTTTIEGYLVSFIDASYAFVAIPVGNTGNYKLEKVLVSALTLTNLGLGETLPIGMSTNGTTLGSIHRAASVSSR